MKYKHKTFCDFWEKVNTKDKAAVLMSLEELKEWSFNVWDEARKKEKK